MYVKPHPERTVSVHLGGQIVQGRVVGGAIQDMPLQVLHPHTRLPIPADGIDVPEDAYWMRRVRDGDVVLAKPPAPPSPAQALAGQDTPPEPAPASAPLQETQS